VRRIRVDFHGGWGIIQGMSNLYEKLLIFVVIAIPTVVVISLFLPLSFQINSKEVSLEEEYSYVLELLTECEEENSRLSDLTKNF